MFYKFLQIQNRLFHIYEIILTSMHERRAWLEPVDAGINSKKLQKLCFYMKKACKTKLKKTGKACVYIGFVNSGKEKATKDCVYFAFVIISYP